MKIFLKIVKSLFIVFGVCFILASAYFCYTIIKLNVEKENMTQSEAINVRWKNALREPIPKDLYCHDNINTLGLQGDGNNYCIFILEEGEATFLTNLSSEKNQEFERAFTNELDQLDGSLHWNDIVIVDKSPDWTQEYTWTFMWQTSDLLENGYDFPVTSLEGKFVEMLYMAYFPESGELYILECLW